MMQTDEPRNAWQWLDEKHYQYLPFWDGYQSPCGKHFITSSVLYKMPGEVIYFLKTGYIRDVAIFDNGISTPTPKSLGLRAHKDGRCVAIRKIK